MDGGRGGLVRLMFLRAAISICLATWGFTVPPSQSHRKPKKPISIRIFPIGLSLLRPKACDLQSDLRKHFALLDGCRPLEWLAAGIPIPATPLDPRFPSPPPPHPSSPIFHRSPWQLALELKCLKLAAAVFFFHIFFFVLTTHKWKVQIETEHRASCFSIYFFFFTLLTDFCLLGCISVA